MFSRQVYKAVIVDYIYAMDDFVVTKAARLDIRAQYEK